MNYCILRKKEDLTKLDKLIKTSYRNKTTVACLVEKDTLKTQKKYKQIAKKKNFTLRKDFIFKLLKQISNNSKIISTTGYTSRELAQIRKEKKLFKGKDFYMVGGMGHSSMVSLGYSLNSKNKLFVWMEMDLYLCILDRYEHLDI